MLCPVRILRPLPPLCGIRRILAALYGFIIAYAAALCKGFSGFFAHIIRLISSQVREAVII